jgi:cereblon
MSTLVFFKKGPTESFGSNRHEQPARKTTQDPASWLVCSNCQARVVREDWLFENQSDVPLIFSNPHGRAFFLLLASRAHGMIFHPNFTTQYSWFPGYAWSIGVCCRCRQHLGWAYRAVNATLDRREFVALDRQAVRRAGDPV